MIDRQELCRSQWMGIALISVNKDVVDRLGSQVHCRISSGLSGEVVLQEGTHQVLIALTERGAPELIAHSRQKSGALCSHGIGRQ
jgi:hypothetical protein